MKKTKIPIPIINKVMDPSETIVEDILNGVGLELGLGLGYNHTTRPTSLFTFRNEMYSVGALNQLDVDDLCLLRDGLLGIVQNEPFDDRLIAIGALSFYNFVDTLLRHRRTPNG